MVRTEGLEKMYGSGSVRTHALRGVDLEIRKGVFAAIVGPSGHGKSTLLNLIGGLDRPTGGKIYLDGVDLTLCPERELAEVRGRKIGFVFQFFNLLSSLTALENVEVAMMFAGVKEGVQKQRAEKFLTLVGLEEKIRAKPFELSGGQQQRVAIARALANDPELLLMDEPTGNLDSESEEEILGQISRLHKGGKTVVIVTHNPRIADRAEEVFEIQDGKVAG
jgi:putative ABC transport system ATP-binding protein